MSAVHQYAYPEPVTPEPRFQWLPEDIYQAEHLSDVAKELSPMTSLTR